MGGSGNAAGTMRRGLRWAGQLTTRLAEIALILIGFWFAFGSDSPGEEAAGLAAWDLIALGYLSVGLLSARRSRRSDRPARPDTSSRVLRVLGHRRLSFLFTFVASLIGIGAVLSIAVTGTDTDTGLLLTIAAVPAMLFAWLLLHAGYARFYAGLYFRDGAGLDFPNAAEPTRVDLLYFAFTLGTSFATSDTRVTTREMRWHVTVHSVVAFFYNLIVLATAVSFLRRH